MCRFCGGSSWRTSLVLLVALALLTFSPIEVSYPIKFGQFLLLFVGFVALVDDEPRPDAARARAAPPAHRGDDLHRPRHARHPARAEDPRSAEGRALAHAFNGMLDRLESARREAARTALEAQESERLRVAQELHDEVGPDADRRHAAGRARSRGRPRPCANQALRDVANAVRDSLDEVRRIARELRPEALDDLGLVNALIALCNRLDGQDGPRIERDLQGSLPPMPPEVELVDLPDRPGGPHERRSGTPTRAPSTCGSRATPSRSRCACATTASACRASCPRARPASPACASGRSS